MTLRHAVALLLAASALQAETAVQRLLEDKLLFGRVKAIGDAIHGALGVATIDLTSGRVFVYNGEAEFPTASTIKVPLMVELFRRAKSGELRLDSPVAVSPSDLVEGSDPTKARLASGPAEIPVADLMRAMIEHSDNTATNKLIGIAGMDSVNGLLASQNMRATRMRRRMIDVAAAARDEENTTSPLEMARFLETLFRGGLADADATKQMIGLMKLVKADIRAAVPAQIEVASKPGDLNGVHCEIAIVYLPDRPFILSVYSTFLNDGENPVPDVAKAAFEYFTKLAASNRYGNRVR